MILVWLAFVNSPELSDPAAILGIIISALLDVTILTITFLVISW